MHCFNLLLTSKFNTKMKQSSPIFLFLIFIIFFSSSTLVSSQESCTSNVEFAKISTFFTFDAASVRCLPVWDTHNFILRYAQASSNVWNFCLSYNIDVNSYVAIGFSGDGNMVGSSAIVGWAASGGVGGLKGYYLGGKKSPADVVPDKAELKFNNYSFNTIQRRMYMAFQLYTSQPSSNLLYAIGPNGFFPSHPDYALTKHIDKISTKIDYQKGTSDESGSSTLALRRGHGILNMMGWSLLMIIGAIISRHFKQYDPIWFYLHTSVQIFGLVVGVVGMLSGLALSKKLSANVKDHKNLAILILVLGVLQVLAIIIRPGKESKIRKYWNWYHHNLGRILIIFAVANAFYGLHIGGEGSKWFAGYGIALAILFIIAVILEIRLMLMKSKNPMFPR